jgi:conjugative relaxase-like TrwC/TraI family protein
MVNISSALNSQKLQAYHAADYADRAQQSYFSEEGEITGAWHGKLAAEMGLSGPISAEQFNRLAEGQDPNTGEQLVRHRIATEDSAAHRAGWDAAFSAPKSVSITALVGGDKRIIEAHREAVKKGLDYLERSVHARIGGNRPPERTAKWAAATFEHDTSRPVNGYSAPQLHTHAVFFNITETVDGKPHALQERHIFAAQKTATAIYQAELGYRLRQLGYELEEGQGGAREIKGYSEECLKANSSRSEQIQELAQRLQAQGLNRAEARQRAAHSTREPKARLTPEQTRAQQKALAAQFGNQHHAVIAQARAAAQRATQAMTPESAMKVATAAVSFSREKSFEREAVVSQHDVLREALRRGQDLTPPDHIEQALRAQCDRGDLLPVRAKNSQPAYTTPEMVAMEARTIRLMKGGQNQCEPFVSDLSSLDQRLGRHFEKYTADAAGQRDPARAHQLLAAVHSQKHAIRQVLTSQDKVLAFQGAAGTGKTTSLTVIRKELERQGYTVKGLAPTSRAAQQLAECGAECSTLQMRLAKPDEISQKSTAYFLDEASLASAKQVNDFLSRLGVNDRVLLIGDARQHEAVEAGRPFAQLQEHGIHTVRLDEIVRQRDQTLLHAVERLAQGQALEALEMLKAQGRVSQIASERDRLAAIAHEFLKDLQGTLVVSPDNRSRAAINDMIHQELKRTGALHHKDHTISVLTTRQDLTGADRKWANSYETGNVLRYNRGTKRVGLKQGEFATVIAIDRAQNLIVVQKRDGKVVSYSPERLHGVSVYRREQRAFAAGDRIQFTAPFKDKRIANRERGTLQAIVGDTLTVALDSGRIVSFCAREHANLDYAYAVTSHTSQGLTADRVLIHVDTAGANTRLINQRLAYVAVSRARHDAHIYTNDAASLGAALSRDISKSSSLDRDGAIAHLHGELNRARGSSGLASLIRKSAAHQRAADPKDQSAGRSASIAVPECAPAPLPSDSAEPLAAAGKLSHGYAVGEHIGRERCMEQSQEEGFGL